MENGTSGCRSRCSQTANAIEESCRDGEGPDRSRGFPAPAVPLGDPQNERDEAGGDEHRSRNVVALPLGVLALAEQERRDGKGGDADRDVDEEDPLPGEQVGEDPAHQDACGSAEAADGTPGAERDVPLTALGERAGQDRERRRSDGRGAEALERAGADQRHLVPGQAAEQRSHGEDDEAGHEDPLAAEDVRQAAAQQHESAEDQRVGADHPLQVLLREAKVFLDRRKGHVDDGDVEHHHELRHAQQDQCVPLEPF